MTRFNNKYPYTDFHELNADWLLETVKDAAAEAKEASDTVATYNDRLTTVEGDLAPIKAAMPGLASDVSDLQHDVGIIDSLITNTINPGLDTLQNEVETPSTGLLDRVSALENQPPATANAVYYLEFDSSLVSIDPDNAYDSRIEYDWLKQFVPLNTSGEDTHVIKLYDSHTQKVYDLAAFHLQESVTEVGIELKTRGLVLGVGVLASLFAGIGITESKTDSHLVVNLITELRKDAERSSSQLSSSGSTSGRTLSLVVSRFETQSTTDVDLCVNGCCDSHSGESHKNLLHNCNTLMNTK